MNTIESLPIPSYNRTVHKIVPEKTLCQNIINDPCVVDNTNVKTLNISDVADRRFRKEVLSNMSEMALRKYYEFQAKVLDLEQKRKCLEKAKLNIVSKTKRFIPFIEENNYRLKRTKDLQKEDITIIKLQNKELSAITSEIRELNKRKQFFTKANIKLAKYESFLLEVLKMLPSDYVKGAKENVVIALLRRFEVLFSMNQIMYIDLTKKADTFRQLIKQVDINYQELTQIQTQRSIRFPKINSKKINIDTDLKLKIVDYRENYNKLRQKLHIFGVLLLAVNNVFNKCMQCIEKGYFCEINVEWMAKINTIDPDSKFKRMEEFVTSGRQMLALMRMSLPVNV